MLYAAVAAAVAGIVAVVVALWPSSNPPAAVNTAGNNACIINGQQNTCSVNTSNEILNDPGKDWKEIRRELLALGKDSVPAGPGPWQFAVLGTGDIGLKIRSNPEKDGFQVGSLGEKNIAWVDCQARSGFDPAGAGGPGPVWYRIRWPQNSPTNRFLNSQPDAPYEAWGYSQYLVPVGQNGAVPAC